MTNNLKYNSNDNNLLILLYHGVFDHKLKGIENYSGKHTNKVEFISQIKFLKENNFNFLSFEDIIEIIISKNKFPKNSVAISFDDGFANNFHLACPILDDFNVSTIFYICSGLIGKKDLFWVDKIEACINNTKKDKIEIYLDKKYSFILKDRETKIHANVIIKKICKRSKINIRNRILYELQKLTEVEPNLNMSLNYEVMNWSQLIKINNNKLFTIGGHNLYHDTFTNISHNKIYDEIYNTIHLLEKNLKTTIEHYSYPEGQESDYNKNVIRNLILQGIKCCPSAIYGFNSNSSNLFHLKRIMPGFMNTKFPIN